MPPIQKEHLLFFKPLVDFAVPFTKNSSQLGLHQEWGVEESGEAAKGINWFSQTPSAMTSQELAFQSPSSWQTKLGGVAGRQQHFLFVSAFLL